MTTTNWPFWLSQEAVEFLEAAHSKLDEYAMLRGYPNNWARSKKPLILDYLAKGVQGNWEVNVQERCEVMICLFRRSKSDPILRNLVGYLADSDFRIAIRQLRKEVRRRYTYNKASKLYRPLPDVGERLVMRWLGVMPKTFQTKLDKYNSHQPKKEGGAD